MLKRCELSVGNGTKTMVLWSLWFYKTSSNFSLFSRRTGVKSTTGAKGLHSNIKYMLLSSFVKSVSGIGVGRRKVKLVHAKRRNGSTSTKVESDTFGFKVLDPLHPPLHVQ